MGFSDTIKQIVDNGLIPNPITLIAQLLATFILFMVIKHWVWKPMTELLYKRQEVIVDELESAKRAREDADTLKLEYEEDLKKAKLNANEILEKAKVQALKQKEQIIFDAEKEVLYKLEKAEKDIELERSKAQAELKSEFVDIAFYAAEKLVNENIDKDKNKKLIDKFIEEVGK